MQKSTDNIFVLVVIATAGTFIMVTSFILIYIRNQAKMFKQRQQMQQAQIAHQKELLQVVIESQEEERVRIGRDLHDDVGAAISSLRMIIEMFKPITVDDTYHRFIKSSKSIIDKMVTDVRHISHNLSPTALAYYGLGFAIEEQCAIINQSGKLEINFINNATALLQQLSMPAATALYRVLEELFNNTIKHAYAHKSNLNFIANNNTLIIEYSDDGKGMDTGSVIKGMGLSNIESRLTVINASYHIETALNKGFYIKINYNLI